MSFFAGVGVSRSSQDSEAAGREAAQAALKEAGIDSAGIAIVVSASVYDQSAVLRGVASALGDTPIVGCTSAGAITQDGVQEQSVAILVLKSDQATFIPAKITGIGADMRGAGKKFAEAIKGDGEAPRMAFMFSDALAGNGTELVRGILEVMGGNFQLAGGAAGDDLNFKKTWQFFNQEALTDAVVGFGIVGSLPVEVGADHGWQPLGNARIATKAEGTKLIELDGKPAFGIYQDYFGPRAADFKKALSLAAVSYPLGMKSPGSGEQIMVRAPLAVGDDGSITCGAEVVEGAEIYLMIGTLSGVLWSAEQTAKSLLQKVGGNRRVVFVSDCVARKILLGERGQEEIALLKSIGGAGCVIFGFYSYGQIAPLKPPAQNIQTCDPGFYEQSISLAVFGA
jgi:hypothetical protein